MTKYLNKKKVKVAAEKRLKKQAKLLAKRIQTLK